MARNNAYLGTTNLVDNASTTVTATSTNASYPATNVKTWTTYDVWKSTATSGTVDMLITLPASPPAIDAWGIANHNLPVGQDVVLASSSDGISYTDRSTWGNPRNYRSTFRKLSAGYAVRYWRIRFTLTSYAIAVGNVWLGVSYRLPKAPDNGFTPPGFDADDDVLNNETQGGAFLGRSVRKRGGKGSFNISNVGVSSLDPNEFTDVINHVRDKPFYFSWDSANFDNESGYCWSDKTPRLKRENSALVSFEISYRSLI